MQIRIPGCVRRGIALGLTVVAACQRADEPLAVALEPAGSVGFGSLDGIATSATCTVAGGDPGQPLVLPPGFTQVVIAAEGPGFPDLADMITFDESGFRAIRRHRVVALGQRSSPRRRRTARRFRTLRSRRHSPDSCTRSIR